MDLRLLLDPNFWFSIRWNPLHPSTATVMAVAFLLLALAGALVPRIVARGKQLPKFERKAWDGVGRPAFVAGALGLLFTFFAYQQVALLSGRFWFLLIGIGFIVAEALAVRTLLQEVPQLKEELSDRERLSRYLPKAKA